MQDLEFKLCNVAIKATIDADHPEGRGKMVVWPSYVQKYLEEMVDGQCDGRGVPMEDGSWTALGVANYLQSIGKKVEGLGEVGPDLDGLRE